MREITRLRRRVPILEARIRELESIICPCESHDFVTAEEGYEPLDGYGTFTWTKRMICKKCRKTITRMVVD